MKRYMAAGTAALLAGALGSLTATGRASADPTETVIVTGPSLVGVTGAVLDVAGAVQDTFSVIPGVEAKMPASAAARLAQLPGIAVTPDLPVSMQSTTTSTAPHTGSDAFLQQTGATSLAAQGDIGQGVTVAVLDTGIDRLPDFAGRLIGGVDLTGGHNPYIDQFGHGTFVAGLIAGNGASSLGQYSGEAPGANLVAIKVAGASGVTDLATVIKGVMWAVANQGRYGIRVLNLSLGFQPTSSTMLNPLDMAVELAWNAGITVVTSAGNFGPFNGTILSPGDDPLVITVGAVDDLAQPTVAADEMNDFSSAGPTNPDGWVKPDVVSSGRSVVSLAARGSTVYDQNPQARIGRANFVGSGTSFATAITSGAAALILEQNRFVSPNQVKARLLGSASPGPVGNPFVDGHGVVNAAGAAMNTDASYNQSTLGVAATPVGATVSLSPTGSADTWNTHLWTGSAWNGSAWNGSAWNGSAWNGSAWNGSAWNGSAWNGSAWNGSAWNGSAWNGSAWN